jgi:hypothetical protein
LSFDATTGEPTWNTIGASQSIYGHSMVYDAVGKRMLIFGGTKDIDRGESALVALDLADPDPAKATFANVTTSGRAPSVFFHGATYDVGNKWMVVAGGVTSGFLSDREATNNTTYALDLTPATPMWTDLTSYRARVAGAMAYVPKHQVSVFTLGRDKMTDPSAAAKIDRRTDALVAGTAPTATTAVPTTPSTPGGPTTPPPVVTTPAPTQPPAPEECDFIVSKVPSQARADAMANPGSAYGYQMLCNPNLRASPYNTIRNRLSMQNPAKPYHALYNALVWSCGCP